MHYLPIQLSNHFEFQNFLWLFQILGAPSMVNTCFSLLRKGARIVLIGLPKEAIHIEDPLPNVVFKSLTLTTVHGRKIFHTWEQCEALVKEGKVNNFVATSSPSISIFNEWFTWWPFQLKSRFINQDNNLFYLNTFWIPIADFHNSVFWRKCCKTL